MGGTKIAVGLVDRAGGVRSLRTVPTGRAGAESLGRAREVAASVATAAEDEGLEILGTGIGLPELVEDGRITSHAVVAWTDAGVEEAFSDYAPIRVDADIWAAGLAEARFGQGAGWPVSVYVNLGTGISHCLLIDGRPFQGQHGRALMSGSTMFRVLDTDADRLVGSCMEDMASGRGISERYQDLTGEAIAGEEIFQRAEGGEAVAAMVVEQSVDLLGHMIANLIDILDPGVVIVGGGFVNVPGLLDRIGDVARRTVWSDRARETPVLPGACGPLTGVIGAGLTLLDRIP